MVCCWPVPQSSMFDSLSCINDTTIIFGERITESVFSLPHSTEASGSFIGSLLRELGLYSAFCKLESELLQRMWQSARPSWSMLSRQAAVTQSCPVFTPSKEYVMFRQANLRGQSQIKFIAFLHQEEEKKTLKYTSVTS